MGRLNRWVVIVLAMALCLPSATAPFVDLLQRGDEHAARLERTAAATAYRDAAALRPGDPQPYLRLARLYLDWGRPREAVVAVAQAEQLGADAQQTEPLWVAAYTARGEWPAAAEHAHRWLARLSADAPDGSPARHALARAYLEMREWRAAASEYESLLDINPADATAHERLGILQLGSEAAVSHLLAANSLLALRVLAAYQEVPPSDSPAGRLAYASALAGRVLLKEKEWALAAYHFERAVAVAPTYADARAYLGHALDQMGYPAEAREQLRQAVALAPNSPTAHLLLGLHYDRLGQLAAARAEYEAAYDLDPHNPATCIEIGETWAAESRHLAAEVWLREAVILKPDDPALWEVLARFYLDNGLADREEAEAALAKLAELAPGRPSTHELQGRAALQRGDYESALRHLSEAVLLDPTRASAYYYLGLLRNARGEHAEAREAFIRASDLDVDGALTSSLKRIWTGPTYFWPWW